MPQVVLTEFNDNDLDVSKRILSNIKGSLKKRIRIVDEDIHPGELKYFISKMNYFIGTRMHSNIFALSSNVKTIAIAYEPKTLGIMSMLGLSKYVLSINNINSHDLSVLFDQIIFDLNYEKVLKSKISDTFYGAVDLNKFMSS